MPKNPRFAHRLAIVTFVLVLTSCSEGTTGPGSSQSPARAVADRSKLGLMTSLPLYWPLGANLPELAGGELERPWQRHVLESRFELEPLDTLSPIPANFPNDPDVDPLAGLTQLAVVQPRGLSPADNVALDDWVRGGGQLLLVLDPALTGEYDLALGDPRRPVTSALIPPVLERWGVGMMFDETQEFSAYTVSLDNTRLPVVLSGVLSSGSDSSCDILADGIVARCMIEKGTITIVADAAVFEHSELAGQGGELLGAVLDYAF